MQPDEPIGLPPTARTAATAPWPGDGLAVFRERGGGGGAGGRAPPGGGGVRPAGGGRRGRRVVVSIWSPSCGACPPLRRPAE